MRTTLGEAGKDALTVDLYWSVRSPYCHLALYRLRTILDSYKIEVRLRPVYPIAIRDPETHSSGNPFKHTYNFMDAARVAEMLDVVFVRPDPDPLALDVAENRASPQQALAVRLTRYAASAVLRDRGWAFANALSDLVFGGIRGWHQDKHLAAVAEQAGLTLGDLDRDLTERRDDLDQVITQNQDDQLASGHWGVPLMVFEGEPFFGQDRIDLMLWRLKQSGLAERRPSEA